MQLTTENLANELRNDPRGFNYGQIIDDDLPAFLNGLSPDPRDVDPSRTTVKSILKIAAGGILVNLEDAAANKDLAKPLRASAKACLLMLGNASETIDLTDASILAMLEAFVTAGIVTKEEQEAILACAPRISRAEFLFGPGVVITQDMITGKISR